MTIHIIHVLKKANNVNVVRVKLWNRPNNYLSRMGHGFSWEVTQYIVVQL